MLNRADALLEYLGTLTVLDDDETKQEERMGYGLWKADKSQYEFIANSAEACEKNAAPIDKTNRKLMSKTMLKNEKEWADMFATMIPPVDESGCAKHLFTKKTKGLSCDVTVYVPEGFSDPLPGIVRIHGGGMCIFNGKEPMFEMGDRFLAKQGIVVCSVHFTNSTVKQFPAGLDDCINAVKWFASDARKEQFNLIRECGVGLFGESGGGNLVLAVGMKLKETDLVSSVFSHAPWNHPFPPETNDPRIIPSFFENIWPCKESYQHMLNMMNMMRHLYTPVGSPDETNPFAWPYFATEEDVRGMAPTMIVAEECDTIRDTAKTMYRLLQRAEVPSWYQEFGGMGHCHMGELTIGELMRNTIATFNKMQTRPKPEVPEGEATN